MDTLRLVLDLLALLAIIVAILKGIFSAGVSVAELKAETDYMKKRFEQIERWIDGHQKCSDKHEEVLMEVRAAVAFMKGMNER